MLCHVRLSSVDVSDLLKVHTHFMMVIFHENRVEGYQQIDQRNLMDFFLTGNGFVSCPDLFNFI